MTDAITIAWASPNSILVEPIVDPSQAITLDWIVDTPIVIEPSTGLVVEVSPVEVDSIAFHGVAGIPGPPGRDGDALDPNFIIDGGNF